jgi:hypothetical protein
MSYDLAKRNRLHGKFNFKLRDWQLELDGVDDPPPRAPLLKSGRPRRPELLWEREQLARQDPLHEESHVG